MSVNLKKVYDLEGKMHELSELNASEMVRHMKWSFEAPKAKAKAKAKAEAEVKAEEPKVEVSPVKEEVKEPVVEDKAPEAKEEEAPEAKEEAPVAEDKPKRGRPSKK